MISPHTHPWARHARRPSVSTRILAMIAIAIVALVFWAYWQ